MSRSLTSSLFVVNTPGRLDVFVATQLQISRTKAAFLILNGHVFVNNKPINKNNFILKVEDAVSVQLPPDVFDEALKPITPQEMPLTVVYEDEAIIVVNKPSGLIAHPTPHQQLNTLANGLAYRARPGQKIWLVHRLDKDTSGLLVAAKNQIALEALQQQIKTRTMKRFYLAIVHHPFGELMGTIDAPIGHLRDESIRFTVINARNPKPALTKFYVLDQNANCALIKCELQTGRTHQIRVHLAFITHPVYNDPLYGLKGEQADSYGQFLHATQLEFNHPLTHQKIFLECAPEQRFIETMHQLGLHPQRAIDSLGVTK